MGMELVSDVLVFEDGQGSVCVVSACRGGLFINHIYSSRPGFIFKYKCWLFSLARELGYARVFCRPNDARLWDLYVRRWGFVADAFGGLVLDIPPSPPAPLPEGEGSLIVPLLER